MTSPIGWRPRLVALDIDGTLLKWVEGAGQTYEQVAPAVHDAVRRAHDAGAHVVLASGRSPHGMTVIADLLDLPDRGRRAGSGWSPPTARWSSATRRSRSCTRRPSTPGPAVEAILREHPTALVAVEERGVGYRVNRPFPAGELVRRDGHHRRRRPGRRARQPGDHPRPRRDRRGLPRPGQPARPARHRLRRRLDRLARPRSRRGHQGRRGSPTSPTELGVDAADVLAIGDGRNDIEMLQWAGRGVAMGQAVEEVIAAADDVTGTVYEDGAATEIALVPRWLRPGRSRAAVALERQAESTDPGSWSFVTLPTDVAEDIRDVMVEPPRGFGSVKVEVVVGEHGGARACSPTGVGSYVLPVKQAVRRPWHRGATRSRSRCRWCAADEHPAPGRDRPRRDAGPLRRHRVGVHPAGARRARRARRPRGLRDRPAAALGRGRLRPRRPPRAGRDLQRRAGLGRRRRPAGAPCGPSSPAVGLEVCRADPGRRPGQRVRRRDAGRHRAGAAVPRAPPGTRRQPARRRSPSC